MKFQKNDRVRHPVFGRGTVTDPGKNSTIEVQFDIGGKKRLDLRYAKLSVISPEEEAQFVLELQRSISETFAQPDQEDAHGHGSHWALFTDDISAFLGATLPTAAQRGVIAPCWGVNNPASFVLSPDEPKGVNLVWPIPRQGMMLVIRLEEYGVNELISAYPWVSEGVQHQILLEKVLPWNNRLEAQIEATIKGMSITFFDTLYSQHKAFYRTGRYYSFILAGFAYSCAVFEPKPFEITDPTSIRILRNTGQGEEANLSQVKVETKGMAALLPIPEWDRDDYWFQAPVKEVTETELLGKKTWQIRATVLRDLDENSDIDLYIYVTENTLADGNVPNPGDDITGRMWLLGYMWYPPTL